MTEEFALDEAFGQGAAVYGNKGGRLSVALIMDGGGNSSFPVPVSPKIWTG